jgi:hypothetical protein
MAADPGLPIHRQLHRETAVLHCAVEKQLDLLGSDLSLTRHGL